MSIFPWFLVNHSELKPFKTVSPPRKVVGHEVLRQYIANVQIDDPVHEIEAHKTDGEYNAAVPVDV